MNRITMAGALSLLVAMGCHVDTAQWPSADWTRSSPERQGVDSAPLAALDAEFSADAHGYIDGMLVIREGYLVFDRTYARDYDTPYDARDHFEGPYNYYNPEWHPYYRRGALHTLQSITKTVTSAVFGIAIDRGDVPGVDEKVLGFFDEYDIANLDDRKRGMTLQHLLTMTAGLDWPELAVPYEDPDNIAVRMEASDDWIQFVLDRPMAHEPGSVFAYNSGVSQLLSYIFKATTGEDLDRYAERHLFSRIGIAGYHWKENPQGLTDSEGGLYLAPHDLARIGYLYLRGGVWAGERVLPAQWVEASVAIQVDSTGNRDFAYGYQWWLAPYGEPVRWAYTAWGYGGQYLFVIPEHDVVAVFTGWNIYGPPPLDPTLALGAVLDAVH